MENKLTPMDRAELIIKEVEELRNSQKAYFKYRTTSILQECKELERRVDKWIKRYWEIKEDEKQPKLF